MREFQITLNEQHIQVLSVALGEVAYKLAAPVIATINQQLNEQQEGNENVASSTDV